MAADVINTTLHINKWSQNRRTKQDSSGVRVLGCVKVRHVALPGKKVTVRICLGSGWPGANGGTIPRFGVLDCVIVEKAK